MKCLICTMISNTLFLFVKFKILIKCIISSSSNSLWLLLIYWMWLNFCSFLNDRQNQIQVNHLSHCEIQWFSEVSAYVVFLVLSSNSVKYFISTWIHFIESSKFSELSQNTFVPLLNPKSYVSYVHFTVISKNLVKCINLWAFIREINCKYS